MTPNEDINVIAYFILVHRYPEQFKRMFKAIYASDNHYLVHIDRNSGPLIAANIKAFLSNYPTTALLPAKRALWGGYSLVDAELRGMAQLLKMDSQWTHFINLSGQDFPLKSQAYIRDFLKTQVGKQFIQALDQAKIRPDTMNRLQHIFIEAFNRIFRTGIARSYMVGVTPYIGTQWKVVSRAFCAFVCHDPAVTRYKAFYRNSFIADEGFFQTVMMNAGVHGQVINDDLRMIDWVPDGDIKLRPRNFTAQDAPALRASPQLFARKFDMVEDPRIFTLLEAHLCAPGARTVPVTIPSPQSAPPLAARTTLGTVQRLTSLLPDFGQDLMPALSDPGGV